MSITFQQPKNRNSFAVFRVNLSVPYSEKEQVKKLGGRWDKEAKTWYVIINNNNSTIPFTKWMKSLKK